MSSDWTEPLARYWNALFWRFALFSFIQRGSWREVFGKSALHKFIFSKTGLRECGYGPSLSA